MSETEQAMGKVERAVADLGEHFDCVTIFVSKLGEAADNNGQPTFTASRSTGNWCARYGQVREWVVFEEERVRCAARILEKEET